MSRGPGKSRRIGGGAVGVAFRVLAGSVCVALLGGCATPEGLPSSNVSEGSPSVSVSESDAVEPSDPAPIESSIPDQNWGAFPPNHLTEVRDLSDPQFPEELSTFVLDGESGGGLSVTATYRDYTNLLSMSATVLTGFATYTVRVEEMQDVAYYGKALCGIPTEFLEHRVCLMVGESETFEVGTAADIPVEELAGFTEELYAQL